MSEKVNIRRGDGPPLLFSYIELETLCREHMFGMGNPGICRNCGTVRDGCEPDAEYYPCDECGENEVDGAEQLYMEVA